MLAQLQEAILSVDRAGRITYINEAAEQLLGWTASEAVGQPVGVIVHFAEEPPGTRTGILRALLEAGIWQDERQVLVDGDEVHHAHISVALTGVDGEPAQAIVTLRDLTRARKQEAAIRYRRQVERALVEASRMLVSSDEVDFEKLLGLVGRAVGAGCVYLVLIPPDEQPFYPQAQEQEPASDLGMKFVVWYRDEELEEQASGSALRPDLKELLESPAGVASSTTEEVTAFAVPVLSSDDLLYGYLGIEHAPPANGEVGTLKTWKDEDVHLLQALGDMLATYFERNMAEQALRDSEERWRRLVESHPEPIIISDRGRILYINPAGAEVVGAAQPEQVIGRSILDFVSAELHDRLIARDEAVLAWENAGPMQHEIVRLDGEDRIVESFSVPIIYRGREVVQTVMRDITERKKSEERYRTFVETISEGIWHCDLDRPIATNALPEIQASFILNHAYIVDCNDVVARVFGVDSPDELVGRHLGRLVRESGLIREFVEKGYRLRNAEYTFVGREGTLQHYVVNAVGTVERGKLVRIWGSFIDVTERVKLERRMVAALEQQQQRIGRDLHDGVGQLLTGIRMLCQDLAESQGLPEGKQGQAAKVARYAEEASQHVRTIYKGLTPVQLYQEGLAAALEELAHNTDTLPNVDCTFEHDGLADVDDRETILHMYRIAQEATNNALKHARAAHVHLILRQEAEGLLLQIQDNGIGFDIEEMEHRTGNSLGLDSMFYRARTIQADFDLISEPGHGTTIRCVLPQPLSESITNYATEG